MNPDDEEAVHDGCKHIINIMAKSKPAWLSLTPELQTMDVKKYRELFTYIRSKYEEYLPKSPERNSGLKPPDIRYPF